MLIPAIAFICTIPSHVGAVLSTSLALGALSDVLSTRYGADSLRYAVLAGTVFYAVAAGLFLLSSRRLKRDWE